MYTGRLGVFGGSAEGAVCTGRLGGAADELCTTAEEAVYAGGR